MGAAAVVPLIVSAVVAGTTTAVAANQAKQGRKEANRIADEQVASQQRLNDENIARQKKMEEDAAKTAARHAKRGGSNTNKGGTILTSPLGVSQAPSVGVKTLLGQ